MAVIEAPRPTAADVLRPTAWDDFIGQEALKSRLHVHIASALTRMVSLEHLLLEGPPGSGKTTLAALIAKDLNEPLYVAEFPFNDADYRNLRGFTGVLLVDEVHRGTRKEQEELMPVAEHGYMRPKGRQRIDLPWVTLICATTDRGRVIEALRDKLTISPPVDDYTDQEIAIIAQKMGARIDFEISDEDALVFGRASAGVPRKASHLVQAARDMFLATKKKVPAAEVLHFMRLTEDGLSPVEVKYLNRLWKMDQSVGEQSMCSMLDCDRTTLLSIERILVRLELIDKTARGRTLSDQGFRRAMEMFGAVR